MPLHTCLIMKWMPLIYSEKATTMASSSIDGTVEGACFGLIARSRTGFRPHQF